MCTLCGRPDGRLLTVGTEDGEDASPGSGVDPASFTVQVTSNETATGPEPDYVITGRTVQLRVARADNGLGRVYTITGSVSDVAGNFGDVGSVVQSPC